MKAYWRRCVLVALLGIGCGVEAAEAPNILWLVAEDINPQLRCYGDTNAVTPNLDRLAQRGLRYTHCWSTAPVCAPARTALISGVYPPSLGGEHMRSEVAMPSFMRMYPQLLRDRGYYCVNRSKEDYNLRKPGKVWAESSARAHYTNRAPAQPFFAAFNMEVTHEGQIRKRPHELKHDPASLRLPAYHPDRPEVRRDWAQYYDNITTMDQRVGRALRELESLGLAEDTIVWFYGDNGAGMPRSKRWPYDSGLHLPLIVFVPEKWARLAPPEYRAGAACERLVEFVDFAPTLLSIAGATAMEWMQGRAFMGAHPGAARKYLFGGRGRMDERYDFVRSVRNNRFIYIRNFNPHLIYGQYIDYMFQTPTTRVWKQLYDAGKLKPPQTYFWESKPPEELYDLEADRDEVVNLANSAAHKQTLEELRKALRDHMLQIRDAGLLPEAEMHRRAAGTTVYEMAHDSAKYPMESILPIAEMAASLSPEAEPELRGKLRAEDPAVRYWAALGLLARGRPAVTQARIELISALEDGSPVVRVVAAQALGQYGTGPDLEKTLAVLKGLASPRENGAYISLMALNAIDALGTKAAPLLDYVRNMPVRDESAPERANGYVARLVDRLCPRTR